VDLKSLIDDFIELTVLASFGRPGPVLRGRLFGWDSPQPNCLAGRTAVVTGPTSGLGRETTAELAALGARIVPVGRNARRLAALRDELTARHGQDRFPIVVADLASLASVRAAAATILAAEDRLDLLVDNAGAMYPQRIVSPDGIEAGLATMVVGPFALVSDLLPLLSRTPGARVVSVTSGGMYTQRVDLGDLQYERRPWSGSRAYAHAKRIQVALVREWSRRLAAAGVGVTVNAMHPGWTDTPGLAESLPGFYRTMRPLLRTPAEGADTIVWLATATRVPQRGGRLYLDRRPRPFDRLPSTRLDERDRRHLWDMVVELSGRPDPLPDAAS
jgi:NAD(P)-dependent dehydrogenase (short-subunit alcohol dehydrogenase family)